MKNITIDLPLLPLNLTLQRGCSYRFLFIGNLLIMYRMYFFFFFLKIKIKVKNIKNNSSASFGRSFHIFILKKLLA